MEREIKEELASKESEASNERREDSEDGGDKNAYKTNKQDHVTDTHTHTRHATHCACLPPIPAGIIDRHLRWHPSFVIMLLCSALLPFQPAALLFCATGCLI
jgi:hypothetical protein